MSLGCKYSQLQYNQILLKWSTFDQVITKISVKIKSVDIQVGTR